MKPKNMRWHMEKVLSEKTVGKLWKEVNDIARFKINDMLYQPLWRVTDNQMGKIRFFATKEALNKPDNSVLFPASKNFPKDEK